MTKPDQITSLKEQLANLRAAKKEYSTVETLEHGQEVVDPETFLLSLVEDSVERDAANTKANDDTNKIAKERMIYLVCSGIILFSAGLLAGLFF